MTELAEDNICQSTDRMRRSVVAAGMAAKLVVAAVVACGLYWVPVWGASLLAWATSNATPREEYLPFWMRILLGARNWFGSALPYLVLAATVFCALLLLLRFFTDARRARTPACLTTMELDGHVIGAWSAFLGLQVIWFDDREVSRKRSLLPKTHHTLSITRGTQDLVFDVAITTLPYVSLNVSRNQGVVTTVRNGAGSARSVLHAVTLGAIVAVLGIYLAETARVPRLELPIYLSTVVLGTFLGGRVLESRDRRLIEAYFRDRVTKKRFVLPRWEWACLPAAALVALSMWVFPTFSQYERACAQGYGRACYGLGTMYMNGDRVDANTVEAVAHFQKACDRGDGYGCDYLAKVYRDGKLVDKDATRAVELFRRACDGGVARSCYSLASAYEKGELVEKDLMKAAELYERACDWNHGLACFVLGDMRDNGKGVEEDLAAAVELYERSCGLGDELGCDSAARAYEIGRGVPEDPAKSVELYLKVCDGDDPMGYAHGCFHVALAYANGDGVDEDPVKAAGFYEKSCQGGNPRACLEVDRAMTGKLPDDVILGRWSNDVMDGGLIEIVEAEDGGYRMQQVSEGSATAVPGETIGELRVDESDEHDYVGRHTWGGSRTDDTRWGRDGGLVLRVLDGDTLFMRFLDSRYSDGWIWRRQ